jgi:hypothetical protein
MDGFLKFPPAVVLIHGMKRKPAGSNVQTTAPSRARKVIDATPAKLRSAVAEVQKHLDAILASVVEAEQAGHKVIPCEPRSLDAAADNCLTVRGSVERSVAKLLKKGFW